MEISHASQIWTNEHEIMVLSLSYLITTVRCEMGKLKIIYSGYGHTVLQNWFFQNKFVTGVFLENTTYVRNTLHDF